MQLKEEYKNIDLKEILMDNLKAQAQEEVPSKYLAMINEAIDNIKQKNCEDLVMAIYLLANELYYNKKIALNIVGTTDSVAETILNSGAFFISFNRPKNKQHRPLEIKVLNDVNVTDKQIIINVPKEEIELVRNTLDKICISWNDVFILEDNLKL